jgi:hypothetical protein
MSLIGDKTYKKFIDTGKIPDRIIYSISLKIIKGSELTEREEAVFYAKTSEINEMIIHLSKSE